VPAAPDAAAGFALAVALAALVVTLLLLVALAVMRLLASRAPPHEPLPRIRSSAELEALARARDPVRSFAAARDLVRLDAPRAIELLGISLVTREDWPLARVASLLHEAGPGCVSAAIEAAMVARPRHALERVARLARFGRRERIAPLVRAWLTERQEAAVVAAALDDIEEPQDAPWARAAVRHEDWRVRVSAARALGRIGDRRELEPLLALLEDPVWRVRYHAAQSLVHLRELMPSELESIRQSARDAYAADMLAHALAERGRRR
jgi:hypothetical protein